MNLKIKFLTVFISVICSMFNYADSYSQTKKIITDRPDQTEGPDVVPLYNFQAESGFVYEYDEADGIKNRLYSYPTVLLRFGLLEKLELRLKADVSRTESESAGTDSAENGIKPLTFGLKVNVCGEKGLRPNTAIIVNFVSPGLATKNLKAENYSTTINFAFSNSITDNLGLGYNLGSIWGGFSEPVLFYTLALSCDISNVVTVFAEGYGFTPENSRADHRFDFGTTVFLKKNIAIDASAGLGITSNAPDFFVNTGVSFRLPR